MRGARRHAARRRRLPLLARDLAYEYPDEILDPGLTPQQTLASAWPEACRANLAGGPRRTRSRAARHELDADRALGYAPYFLTVHEIVRFASERGHPLPGPRLGGEFGGLLRARHHRRRPQPSTTCCSSASSSERDEPPDIDVDFEHERREEVIQYIYQRYGRDRAAHRRHRDPLPRRAAPSARSARPGPVGGRHRPARRIGLGLRGGAWHGRDRRRQRAGARRPIRACAWPANCPRSCSDFPAISPRMSAASSSPAAG